MNCTTHVVLLPLLIITHHLKLCHFLTVFRSGNTPETRGTTFVVYEDIVDAKNACDHLSGFNVCNRYLVVLYYQSTKVRGDVFSLLSAVAVISSKYKLWLLVFVIPYLFPESIVL